jgi:hypothetical protein
MENELENVPEITAPQVSFYSNAPGIETIQSCLNSTDFVMTHCRHDIQVMLMRILQNQKTIMEIL